MYNTKARKTNLSIMGRHTIEAFFYIFLKVLYIFQYLFSEDPTNEESCHYCVYIYVRTPNILEKKESKYNPSLEKRSGQMISYRGIDMYQ